MKKMIEKIFFQTSMPRAGSTLLQNILAQNPDIYATPTSGVLDLFLTSRNVFTNSQEFKAQDEKEMTNGFKGYCKGALEGFFNGVTDKKYAVDKCRGWGGVYRFVNEFYPNPKMVVMVRDLRGIICSLEKKFRDNPIIDSGMQGWGDLRGTTIDKRVQMWLYNVPPLHLPLDLLYDNILKRLAKNFLFIRYEDLTANPGPEIEKIYKYFEISNFKHDFDNVEQLTKENDIFYRPFGDHMIRGKITPMKENYVEVLGKHNCNFITEKFNWYYKAFNYPI